MVLCYLVKTTFYIFLNSSILLFSQITKIVLHPSNKHDVGNRLAGFALQNEYEKNRVASRPLYKRFEVAENTLIIEFDLLVLA